MTTRLAWCDFCDEMTPLETCRECGLPAKCGNCERCESWPCNDDWGDDERDEDL